MWFAFARVRLVGRLQPVGGDEFPDYSRVNGSTDDRCQLVCRRHGKPPRSAESPRYDRPGGRGQAVSARYTAAYRLRTSNTWNKATMAAQAAKAATAPRRIGTPNSRRAATVPMANAGTKTPWNTRWPK